MINSNFVIEVKNLSKKYGKRIAVNNVSFNIKAGEIVGFLGPNGAGKTTTIKMLTGLIKITEGEAYICGNSISRNFEKAVKNIGAIIEGPDMYSYMTGMDNLKFYALISGKKVTQKTIDDVVKIVGLTDRINDKVKSYSLGMKQRLGIAQSLLNKPKVLILDEPTNGLDPEGIKDIRNLLKTLAKKFKMSVLISSHNLKEMQDMCERVIIINNGKILGIKSISGLNSELSQKSQIEVIVDYPNYAGKIIMYTLRTKVDVAGRKIIFKYDSNKIPKIISLLTSKRVSVFGISSSDQNLEDIYFNILNQN